MKLEVEREAELLSTMAVLNLTNNNIVHSTICCDIMLDNYSCLELKSRTQQALTSVWSAMSVDRSATVFLVLAQWFLLRLLQQQTLSKKA